MNNLPEANNIWNSLNFTELNPGEADVTVLGIPFDGAASFRKGAAFAPDKLREISRHIPPTTEEGRPMGRIKVLDMGNILPEGLCQKDYFAKIEVTASKLFKTSFPTFIGGDHSVSIPLIHAAHEIWGKNLGIVHLDAHMDLCHEIGGNILSHGCTHRRGLENKNLDLDRIWFVGIRSFENQELDYLRGKKANIITASDVYQKGLEKTVDTIRAGLSDCSAVYLTLDIDFLDPAYAPGTGTPKPGGFSSRELLILLKELASLPLVGMDVVEVSPPLDHNDITSFAAQRAITEIWGRIFS